MCSLFRPHGLSTVTWLISLGYTASPCSAAHAASISALRATSSHMIPGKPSEARPDGTREAGAAFSIHCGHATGLFRDLRGGLLQSDSGAPPGLCQTLRASLVHLCVLSASQPVTRRLLRLAGNRELLRPLPVAEAERNQSSKTHMHIHIRKTNRGCSSTGPGFSSQHTQDGSQPFGTPAPGDPASSSGL